MKKILVVVDMQNDFIDGPLGTPEARAIVDNVCAKIREGEWDYLHTTHDTHEADYLTKQEGQKLPIPHCLHFDIGWALNEKVRCALIHDSAPLYMHDKDTFGSISLVTKIGEYLDERPWLKQSDIELTLVGVCTDICVISNALLLKAHYPEMKIVVDASCCAGSTPEKHYMALEVMKSCQVDVINNDIDDLKKDIAEIFSSNWNVPKSLFLKEESED